MLDVLLKQVRERRAELQEAVWAAVSWEEFLQQKGAYKEVCDQEAEIVKLKSQGDEDEDAT